VSGLLNLSEYDRIIALDTQMVFEARPLDQLNWASMSSGTVLLLILPQVSSEIDAHKRDGRLGTRARNFNRLLDPSIENGEPSTIVEQPVRIDLAYVAAGQIDWFSLDDLDRENGDDLIVAQALNALVDDPTRVEIMSFDSRPRAAARRHGMRALKPDESWLLEPEPSPTKRRVAELEQERFAFHCRRKTIDKAQNSADSGGNCRCSFTNRSREVPT
jgi:PIN domain